MNLKQLTWLNKSFGDGKQIIVEFNNYNLSIINDGYGKEKGLYEISVFKDGDQIELPGITDEGDTVKGWLTEADVDTILLKMYTITGTTPRQV